MKKAVSLLFFTIFLSKTGNSPSKFNHTQIKSESGSMQPSQIVRTLRKMTAEKSEKETLQSSEQRTYGSK